jgi:TetR/AcrR family transcriptional regulator, tetracycline repressor protein
VNAALALLDEVGLERFTMRALATRLGTYPATIYWHVGNRGEVLSALVEMVFDEIELAAPSTAWDEWLAYLARSYRAAMHRHPNVASLVATRAYARVTAPWLTETILAVLQRGGFAGDDLATGFNAFVGSLVGWVGAELSNIGDFGDDWPATYEAQVRGLAPDEFPTIAAHLPHLADRVFSLRWRSGAAQPMDQSFALALDMWIDGLRRRSRQLEG